MRPARPKKDRVDRIRGRDRSHIAQSSLNIHRASHFSNLIENLQGHLLSNVYACSGWRAKAQLKLPACHLGKNLPSQQRPDEQDDSESEHAIANENQLPMRRVAAQSCS